MKTSESGAPIQTGCGLQDVRRRIEAAFEVVHLGQPAPVKAAPVKAVQEEKPPRVYTEQHAEKFHRRVKALTLGALTSAHVTTTRSHVFEITVPSESAEELYKAALGGGE